MTYSAIVVDPPWELRWRGRHGMPYATMTLREIRALPVGDLASGDAHLYLWVTPELHRRGVGYRVARHWGFDVLGEIIWAKAGMGMGRFPRPAHEPVLVCRRGELPFKLGDVPSVQRWKMVYERLPGNRAAGRKHSAKPDGFLDLVEQASPGPYLELFARRQRLGWDTWGNEALEHVAFG